MNVEFINPFITATVNVMTTMAFLTPERGKPQLKSNEIQTGADISGVIGIADGANGWVAIGLSKQLALKLTENMLGVKKQYIDADVRDATGEIVNMIAGGAKAELAQKGYTFKIAIPTVVVGDNHELGQMKGCNYIVIPFVADGCEFFVSVCIEAEKAEKSSGIEKV